MSGAAKDDSIDALYAGDLDDFMALRTKLVAEAKAQKNKASIEALKSARKPTVIAWAINQVARRHRKDVEALYEAGDALRDAQTATLAGKGADAMREARANEREAVLRVRRHAQELLASRGHEASTDQLRRIEQTFRAAATGNAEIRDVVIGGRLASDLGADEDGGMASFEALAASMPVSRATTDEPAHGKKSEPAHAKPSGPAHAKKSEAAHAQKDEPDRQAEERAAREAQREAEERERDAERAAAQKRKDELMLANAALKDAEARAHDAEQAAREAEKGATAAEREAENARARATAARADADAAAAEVDAATARVAELRE